MDVDEIIVKTFIENQSVFFPVVVQREAKSFVKLLFKNGLNGLILSHEIGESETNFASWKNGLNRSGIGKKMIKRINKPIEDFLWSDGELSELEKDLKSEIEKIKTARNKKTKIKRRIELGRSPTTKSVMEKASMKEKRSTKKGITLLQNKTTSLCSFDDYKSIKSISSAIYGIQKSADDEKQSSNLSLKFFHRGISWAGPEKENNGDFVEDFKTIKLKKTGRIDLFENDERSSDSDNKVKDTNSSEMTYKSTDITVEMKIEKHPEAQKVQEVRRAKEPETTDDPKPLADVAADKECSTEDSVNNNEPDGKSIVEAAGSKDDNILAEDPSAEKDLDNKIITADYQISNENDAATTAESSSEIADNGKDSVTSNTVDYLYVFTDSNSCNNSPVKSHRFKIGVAFCPYEELKKASEFNVDIKLISATAVKNPQQVIERVQEELQEFLMKGRDSWYYCSLTKVLQTTSEAVGWASNIS